jgi:hypothetical protein
MPRGTSLLDEALLQRRLWTPNTVRPRLWFDAGDIATISNATGVSEWRDKSGRGLHLSQAVAADQPLFVANQQNGLSVIRNASADTLTRSSVPIFNNVGQGWIFLVVRWPTAADATIGQPVVFFATGTNPNLTRASITAFPSNGTNTLAIGARRLDSDGFQQLTTSTTRASVQDRFIIQTAHLNWAAGQANHWTNGTQDLTAGAFLTAGNTSPTDSSSITALGLSSVSFFTPNGTEIAEYLVFENNLPANRQVIEGYLAWKWGLRSDLPASHLYRNRPPLIGD